MNMVTELICEKPKSMEKIIWKHWETICLGAAKEIKTLNRRRRQTMVPASNWAPPVDRNDRDFIGHYFVPYGAMLAGKWVNEPANKDPKKRVVFFWPYILGALPLLPGKSPVSLIYLSLTVWGFAQLIRRQSVLMFELMRRDLLNAISDQRIYPELRKEFPPLSVEEKDLLAKAKAVFLKPAGDLIQAFRLSFCETFGSTAPLINPLGPTQLVEMLPPGVLAGCSVWNTEEWKTVRKFLPEKHSGPIIENLGGSFTPEFKDPMLREILFARHVTADRQNIFGVRRCTEIYPESLVVLVDMGEYAEYRTENGIEFYKELRKYLHLPQKQTWRQVAAELVYHFNRRFSGLEPPGGDYNAFRPLIEKAFPNASIDHIVFIPKDAVLKKLGNYSKTAKARGAPKSKTKAKRSIHSAVIESPPISNADGRSFRFLVARRGNNTYLSPPWELKRYLLRPNPGPRSCKPGPDDFKPGIILDKAAERFFVTYKFLRGLPYSPLEIYPELDQWLAQLARMTSADFKEIKLEGEARYVDYAKRRLGHSARYTREENTAICELYKEKMTDGNKQELMRVCAGRSWDNIRVRARKLCWEMLEAGCIEKSHLPTRNYNAAIGKKIAENKKALGIQTHKPCSPRKHRTPKKTSEFIPLGLSAPSQQPETTL